MSSNPDLLVEKRRQQARQQLGEQAARLYDAWDELRVAAESSAAAFQKFTAAVQAAFDARKKTFDEDIASWQKTVIEIEQKKFNIEAQLRAKPLPFPKTTRPTADLVSDAKRMTATARAATEQLLDPTAAADLVCEAATSAVSAAAPPLEAVEPAALVEAAAQASSDDAAAVDTDPPTM